MTQSTASDLVVTAQQANLVGAQEHQILVQRSIESLQVVNHVHKVVTTHERKKEVGKLHLDGDVLKQGLAEDPAEEGV
jgi:hypothetical protein